MNTVSNEAVAEYLPRVHNLARRFNGIVPGCEYDDLYQEGSEHVFLCIRDGKHISNTGIKNAMRDWVRICARRGHTDDLPEDHPA